LVGVGVIRAVVTFISTFILILVALARVGYQGTVILECRSIWNIRGGLVLAYKIPAFQVSLSYLIIIMSISISISITSIANLITVGILLPGVRPINAVILAAVLA